VLLELGVAGKGGSRELENRGPGGTTAEAVVYTEASAQAATSG
jgi:hypothetical protein